MGEVAEKLREATYADLEALPENVTGQLIDGDLYAMPRPATRHSLACTRLASRLDGPFGLGEGGPGGWLILVEPELHFSNSAVKAGKDVLVPDLAAWRTERADEVTEGVAVTCSPDWICEVLSPSNEKIDRKKKMPIYARNGVRWAWLVDPAKRTLETYRLEGQQWVEGGQWHDAAMVRAEPFDAVELKLAVLWTR